MKFQNHSLNFFLNGRKDGRTNERTSRNQYALHFFKVGGIKKHTAEQANKAVVALMKKSWHLDLSVDIHKDILKKQPIKPVLLLDVNF